MMRYITKLNRRPVPEKLYQGVNVPEILYQTLQESTRVRDSGTATKISVAVLFRVTFSGVTYVWCD